MNNLTILIGIFVILGIIFDILFVPLYLTGLGIILFLLLFVFIYVMFDKIKSVCYNFLVWLKYSEEFEK